MGMTDSALQTVLPRDEVKAIDVSVIMISYNTEALLPRTLNALKRAGEKSVMEVVIVDNASRDGSVGLLRREFPEVELIVNSVNVGFGRACNQALARTRGRYVLLLNTDAFVPEDALEKTVRYMDAHPRCGILGVRLVDQDGVLQPSARTFMTPWSQFVLRTGLHRIVGVPCPDDEITRDHSSVQQCDWVPGCYYLIRRQLINELGLFDPRYFLYFEEVDYCFAAKRASWDVTYFPGTTVVHIGGESAKSSGEVTQFNQLDALQIESELLFFRKNKGVAAVIANLILVTLADMVDVLRCLLKGRERGDLARVLRHTWMEWSLFVRTRCGLRPTQ